MESYSCRAALRVRWRPLEAEGALCFGIWHFFDTSPLARRPDAERRSRLRWALNSGASRNWSCKLLQLARKANGEVKISMVRRELYKQKALWLQSISRAS